MVVQLIPQQAINLLLRGLASNHAVHLGVQGKSKEDHHTVWSNFLCSTHLETSLWLLYETGSEGLHGRRTPKDHLWSQTLQVVSLDFGIPIKIYKQLSFFNFPGFSEVGWDSPIKDQRALADIRKGGSSNSDFRHFLGLDHPGGT